MTLAEWLEVLSKKYAAQAKLKSSTVFDVLAAIRSTSEKAVVIMGVLSRVPTPDKLVDLERNLYWGLSVVNDAVPELDDVRLADGGIGYVIGHVGNSALEIPEFSSPKNEPKLEHPHEIRATDYQEDVYWWRDE